ncbi:MAG: hypothetical protein RIB78_11750 [Gammaproteobacteria bacterium]
MNINQDYLIKFNLLVIEFAGKSFEEYLNLYENEDSFVEEYFIDKKKLILRVSVLELEKDEEENEYLHISISMFDESNNYSSAKYSAGFFYYKESGIDEIFINLKY